MKQPTNCSRLSQKKKKTTTNLMARPDILCRLASVECERLPTHHRAEPSWRLSIRLRRRPEPTMSPIHFCLRPDIYHSDVIEISIHPVCVSPTVCVSRFSGSCLFVFSPKRNDHTADRRTSVQGKTHLRFSGGNQTFFGKETMIKRFRFFYLFFWLFFRFSCLLSIFMESV